MARHEVAERGKRNWGEIIGWAAGIIVALTLADWMSEK